ncbi:MAG: nucleotide exchange factor GrpE [Lachnospiraceae bacterium]|nr:nucleotide exchange factor GrpE [Lachnospiraceae bacterium]
MSHKDRFGKHSDDNNEKKDIDKDIDKDKDKDKGNDTEGCPDTENKNNDEDDINDKKQNDAGEKDNKSSDKEVKEKKDPKQEKIDELNDKVMRQMAEFENFRKRTEKEKDSMFESGARSVIEKILPIVDNFERGIQTVPDEEKEGAFVKGIQMIYKQLTDELDKMGVKPIDALGKPFDPNFHNAVMQVDSDEYETGTVAQELQKGYIYHDVVIRHSMVAVVK